MSPGSCFQKRGSESEAGEGFMTGSFAGSPFVLAFAILRNYLCLSLKGSEIKGSPSSSPPDNGLFPDLLL